MRKLVLIMVVGSTLIAPARTEQTGNSTGWFAEMCGEKQKAFSQGLCLGYAMGVADALDMGRMICGAQGKATYGQFMKLAEEHVKDNPEKHHTPAVLQLTYAFIGAFPCPK